MNAAEATSSPGSLSSPPHSPEHGTPRSSSTRAPGSAGAGAAAKATSTPTAASASATPAPRLTASGAIRKKPGPKPKPKDPAAAEEKKTRKPRKAAEPKDVAAAVVPVARKRRTKASMEAQDAVVKEELAVQQQLQQTHLPPQTQQQQQQQQQQHHQHQQHRPETQHTPALPPQARPAEQLPVAQPDHAHVSAHAVPQTARIPVASSLDAQPLHGNPTLSHVTTAPSTPRPASSGQRYDPIRGGLFESKPPSAASVPPAPISPPLNRASASPSIKSLIDPPTSAYSQPARLTSQQPAVTSAAASPVAVATRQAPSLFPQQDPAPQPTQPPPQPQQSRPLSTLGPMPMDIDSDANSKQSVPMKKTDSTSAGTPSHSNAPTPPVKAARAKEAPPPLPMGSGLLSGTAFNPGAAAEGGSEQAGVNIWLSFNLKGRENVMINFAQEVERQYGFAALHPRIAAQRERRRQITAAGAALERAAGVGSADDMSLDVSENESNNDGTGQDDAGSATANGAKKRRKRKQEDYDKDDDFIDDTELAWEQQALMAKDGFFVYSGPLVSEEKPAVERADGTIVKRGRGRGRGGSTRGETSGRGRGRGGGGPGSRGGNTVRKPRVTKADRALMEQEKLQREKLAQNLHIQSRAPAAAATSTGPATATTASAAYNGMGGAS